MDEESVLDETAREALQRVRELIQEVLPLLAVTESLLDVPEEERLVGKEWIEGHDRGRARPGQGRRGR